MATKSVIQLTTAPAGTGKTYMRVRFLVDDLLPGTEKRVITNLPLNIDAIVDYCVTRHGLHPEDVRERIQLIPSTVYDGWMDGTSGPWDYFVDSIDQCHIIIDEVHRICGSGSPRKVRKRYQDWLGEIRHRGATIEFVSQDETKIAREIINEAAYKRVLVSSEDRRDPLPYCGIPLSDWYELRAGITGVYFQCVWEMEYRKVGKAWKLLEERMFWILPEICSLYDSYSAPQGGGVAGGPEKREYQRRNFPSLCWWFFTRHPLKLSRLGLFVLVCLLLLGGGAGWALGYVRHELEHAISRNIRNATASEEKPRNEQTAKAEGPNSPPRTASASPRVQPLPAPLPAPVPATQPAPLPATTQPATQPAEPPPLRVRLVMLAPGYVEFADGEVVKLGESTTYPNIKGPLNEIDIRDGSALFGSLRLRLGVERVFRSPTDAQ